MNAKYVGHQDMHDTEAAETFRYFTDGERSRLDSTRVVTCYVKLRLICILSALLYGPSHCYGGAKELGGMQSLQLEIMWIRLQPPSSCRQRADTKAAWCAGTQSVTGLLVSPERMVEA
jgi:hypothetical protein